ncbi:MAG: response regulator, partial [Syntrophothermus sp.]
PIRKELMEAGGLSSVCSKVIKHLAAVFPVEEVLGVFKSTDIKIDEGTLTIEENNAADNRQWDMLFEIIYEKKGVRWLSEVQPLALELADGFSLSIPEVFTRLLTRYEEKMRIMDKENINLKELNEELLSTMEMTLERLTKDPVTKLFNEGFFRDFLQQEVNNTLENNDDFTIFIISIDQVSQILFNSGPELLNEVTTQLVFLLQNIKQEGKMLFRLDGSDLAFFLPRTKLTESLALAEQIRNSVTASGLFVMPITISAGAISLGEFKASSLPKESLASFIISTGKSRLNIARSSGSNIICSSSDLSSDIEERKKVLVIDPDEMNLEILSKAFAQYDYEVILCSDGDKGIKLLETEPPSLVISEIMVPKADGFLIRERMLKSSTLAGIPMVYISNFKDEKNIQRAHSLSVMYYLKKPYMLSELTGIVRNILRSARI